MPGELPCLFARHRGDDLHQLGMPVVNGRMILGGDAGKWYCFRQEVTAKTGRPIRPRVIVCAGRPRKEACAAKRQHALGQGIGNAAFEPADGTGARPGEDHAFPPCVTQRLDNLPLSQQSDQVACRATPHVDNVVLEEPFAKTVGMGLEKPEMRKATAMSAQLLVELLDVRRIVAVRRTEKADAWFGNLGQA